MKSICFILAFAFTAATAEGQTSDSSICSNIERVYNEFDKETTFYTPVLKPCSLSKTIKGKQTRYYLSLKAYGANVTVNRKGAKVLLSNGRLLSFPAEEIDTDVDPDGSLYVYSVFIGLTADKLALLQKFGVSKWELYIYQYEQTPEEAEEFRKYVSCVVGMK